MLEINKLQKKYENFELNCSMKDGKRVYYGARR